MDSENVSSSLPSLPSHLHIPSNEEKAKDGPEKGGSDRPLTSKTEEKKEIHEDIHEKVEDKGDEESSDSDPKSSFSSNPCSFLSHYITL
jgi:hypothetical protein